MRSAFSLPALEQHLFDQYPSIVRLASFTGTSRRLVGGIDPGGRELLARILHAGAWVVEEQLLVMQDILVAPQLILVSLTAQTARDLAIVCRRYAGVSLGKKIVALTQPSLSALMALEGRDPARGVHTPMDGTRDLLTMLSGVTIQ